METAREHRGPSPTASGRGPARQLLPCLVSSLPNHRAEVYSVIPSLTGNLLSKCIFLPEVLRFRQEFTIFTHSIFYPITNTNHMSKFLITTKVISCKVAMWVGFSSSLWIGIMGKSWSMAQRSGKDWNNEKLQKYLSAKSFGSEVKSSGTRFKLLAMWFTSRAMLQNSLSILARDLRSSRPRLNRLSASSRISWASCQISKEELLVRK